VVIFLDEENFLADAVESVLAQTYSRWQLILVDDGSSDRSAEIAQRFAARDTRIRYVTHPGGANRGMSASRNRGVASSSGELIAFLDADDVWLPRKLEEQVAVMAEHEDVGLLYGRTEWWYSWTGADASQPDYLYDPNVPLDSVASPPSLLPALIRDDGSPPYTCSMMVRRNVYERLGGFEESFRGLYEDQAFFAKVFLEEPVYVDGRCWDRYRQHDASACSIGLRTGELHSVDLSPSRGAFLEWLDGYLDTRGVRDAGLRDPLEVELAPYRYPAAPASVESVELTGLTAIPELAGFAIDLPKQETVTGGRLLHILGWAIGRHSRVTRIELRDGDRVLVRAPIDDRRPDLAAAFPDLGAAQTAGFRATISLTGMEPLTVQVVAVLEDGGSAELGRIEAKRELREHDAVVGLPIVSVLVATGAPNEVAGTIESVLAQTYPNFEIVVDAGREDVARRVETIPGVRALRSDRLWNEAALGSARGSLIIFVSPPDRFHPDALRTAVIAFADNPSAALIEPEPLAAASAPVVYQRFTLESTDGHERLERARYGRRLVRRGRANGAGDGGTVILMYHRVGDTHADPWALAVSPARFAEHLDLLSARYDVVPLHRALDGSDRTRVVVTFDDGYADNLQVARLLAARGMAATFFLAAGQLGSDREFWWDDLDRILLAPGTLPEFLDLEVHGEQVRFDLRPDQVLAVVAASEAGTWRAAQQPSNSRQSVYLELYRLLHGVDHEARQFVLDQIADWSGAPRQARPSRRVLSLDEVVQLSDIEGAEIGAHTVTHPLLVALPLGRQREEIVGGRQRLEDLVGADVRNFAYPHGRRADYSAETVALVEEAGFSLACAGEGGAVGSSPARLELSRLMVEDWDGTELERRIEQALGDPCAMAVDGVAGGSRPRPA
jgi:glycosyltransferase involved in cell wall biosynthesis/peptidoglycan/xylan/chitin deacetylase (PgdA/CDA1 family)